MDIIAEHNLPDNLLEMSEVQPGTIRFDKVYTVDELGFEMLLSTSVIDTEYEKAGQAS